MEKTQKIKSILSFIFATIVFAVLPAFASAATLHFSPSSGEYAVGKIFSVNVYVSSADQATNAASGVISFPSDKLEVVSLSKTGSIFTLWVQEPSFSNSAGTVNFEGIVLNPGFTGPNGKVITVTFRIKAAGNAPLTFSSGSVLANDGKGTNILSSLGSALFSVSVPTIGPQAPESTTPSETVGVPVAPRISSSTHPDTNKWYADNNPKFEWSLSKDVNGVNVLADRSPNTNPGTRSDGLFSSYTYKNVDEGIWYFHIRLKNDAGWGGISHFRFQIDTEKPSSFDIQEIIREDLTNPKVKFKFDAKDETSGIDYYDVQIDNVSQQVWRDDGSGIYETPALGPGKHLLIAKVVDKAGNALANSAEFTIKALELPTIVEYPRKLQSGEILVVKGTTYPNAQVVLWLQREKEDAQSYIAKSDKNGNFTFIADEKLKDGIYKLWTEVIDERGARSSPSEKIIIAIAKPAILRVGSWAVSLFAVVVPLVVLIFILLSIIWYGWHKFSLFRKKVRKETKETKEALHQAFKALKEETEEQVAKLDSKPDLSEREKKICNNLKKALKISEEFIDKEIGDIEKEIKK